MAPRETKGDALNLKAFNTTGNDNTTTEVLRQQVSPEAKKRYAALIAIVVAALVLMLYVAYQRSGLQLIPSSEESRSIGQAANQAAQERKDE